MISLYRYRIPFRHPFELAGMKFMERDGLIVQYRHESIDEYSEIAPLPGFSTETTDQAATSVLEQMDTISRHASSLDFGAWNEWLHSSNLPPSVRFGLDILLNRIAASKQGIALHRLLNPQAPDRVGTNAVIGIIPASEIEERTSELVDGGYRTIKYKVADPEPYMDAWMRVRSNHPKLAMRFDANGSWASNKAEHWTKMLESIRPEYLEQPMAAGCESTMNDLRRHIGYPIAFDESARDLGSIQSILGLSASSVLILKPSLLGSVKEFSDMVDAIRSNGAKFTVTTLMEGGIGRNSVASVAAAYSDEGCDHGLGTGSLFADDVLTDLGIEDGNYLIDAVPSRRINRKLLETHRIN
jgi:o-succinylbenzoate synthase